MEQQGVGHVKRRLVGDGEPLAQPPQRRTGSPGDEVRAGGPVEHQRFGRAPGDRRFQLVYGKPGLTTLQRRQAHQRVELGVGLDLARPGQALHGGLQLAPGHLLHRQHHLAPRFPGGVCRAGEGEQAEERETREAAAHHR